MDQLIFFFAIILKSKIEDFCLKFSNQTTQI
jgi:hypothetical protein